MIYVIGIGLGGRGSLSDASLKLIAGARCLAGGKRHLALFPDFDGVVVPIGADLDGAAKKIERYLLKGGKAPAVVLATGDPSLFGIADFIIKKFGKRSVRVVPNVSVAQEAFARIGERWNGAKVLSVHGRPGGVDGIIDELMTLERSAVFTDRVNTPSVIAKALIRRGAGGVTLYICESLGTNDERVRRMTLKEAAAAVFDPLNVIVIIKGGIKDGKSTSPATAPLLGIDDGEFARTGELITKPEVRVVTLAKLALESDSVLWDIGAGSGSVGIEAARLMARGGAGGRVVAFEKNKVRIENIRKNIKKFGVTNVEVVAGTAPASLGKRGGASPDRVFVGGGGTGVTAILGAVASNL